MNIISAAHAAETLVLVSPPTDWTGIGIAVGLAVLVVAVLLLVNHWRRPGLQLGEEQWEKLVDMLHKKTTVKVIDIPPGAFIPKVTPSTPLVYDNITFADQKALDTYKASKGKP